MLPKPSQSHGAGGVVKGPQQDLYGLVGAGGVSEGGPQPRQGPGCSQQEGEGGVHGSQVRHGSGGGSVAPRNSLNVPMGNARNVNWSKLVTRRSMKDEVKPVRPGSIPEWSQQ